MPVYNANHLLGIEQMSLPSLKQEIKSQEGYLVHGLTIYMFGTSKRSTLKEVIICRVTIVTMFMSVGSLKN
jgi:hypothetical protein